MVSRTNCSHLDNFISLCIDFKTVFSGYRFSVSSFSLHPSEATCRSLETFRASFEGFSCSSCWRMRRSLSSCSLPVRWVTFSVVESLLPLTFRWERQMFVPTYSLTVRLATVAVDSSSFCLFRYKPISLQSHQPISLPVA